MAESTCGSSSRCSRVKGLKATMMMITAQVISAGINILYKFIGNDGMNVSILMTYRFLFASIVVVPLALLLERNKRPKLTWKILLQAALCALFGGPMALIMYAEGVILSSPTLAAAFANLIPPLTFIIAIFFRLESVKIGEMAGKAKVIGTVMGVGGGMLLTFYKGQPINMFSTHFHLLAPNKRDGDVAYSTHQINSFNHHIIGSLLAFAAILSMSLSLIIQTKMSERYPCHYSSTALINVIGFLQSLVFALCNERRWSQWKLGWNIRLLTVLYLLKSKPFWTKLLVIVFFSGSVTFLVSSRFLVTPFPINFHNALGIASGVLASGVTFIFVMSCVRMQGPLFVSSFNPLVVVLVAISGSLILGEQLYVGSVLGSVIVIAGLYIVLWGKSKDIRKEDTPTINTTTNMLETSSMAPAIHSKEDEDHELQVKSEMGKLKDQEIDEGRNRRYYGF